MKQFGDFLKELRTNQDLPLRKVAAFLDIDTSVLSKIERGERLPTRETVIKIAEFFSIDYQELLTNYLGEQVAKIIYKEDNCTEILKAAKINVDYLRAKSTKQSYLNFDNE